MDMNELVKIKRSVDQARIRKTLEYLGIFDYIINDDNTVDLHQGVVRLSRIKMTKLPVKFRKVFGSLYIEDMGLETLEGCPSYVQGHFYCTMNKLKNLVGCPKQVDGVFSCARNNLETLDGATNVICQRFDCSHNELKTLELAPPPPVLLTAHGNPCSDIYSSMGFTFEAHELCRECFDI